MKGAGGTEGGVGQFFLGLLMAVGGAYLLTSQVSVSSGWLLTAAGAAIIFLGILMNLRIYFEPTSLFNTLLMLVLLAGGLGLVARSLKPYA